MKFSSGRKQLLNCYAIIMFGVALLQRIDAALFAQIHSAAQFEVL